jgi:hypothetical protein
MKLFISYRRSDSTDVAGRIYDRLTEKYGRNSVFKDVDKIPLGVDFSKVIEDEVNRCDILLAIIGMDWLTVKDESGKPRLYNPNDFVRLEIEAALKRNIPVIPLFVRGIVSIDSKYLPESLHPLALRNGTPIRSDPDFHSDIDRLIRKIAELDQYFAAHQDLPKDIEAVESILDSPDERPDNQSNNDDIKTELVPEPPKKKPAQGKNVMYQRSLKEIDAALLQKQTARALEKLNILKADFPDDPEILRRLESARVQAANYKKPVRDYYFVSNSEFFLNSFIFLPLGAILTIVFFQFILGTSWWLIRLIASLTPYFEGVAYWIVLKNNTLVIISAILGFMGIIGAVRDSDYEIGFKVMTAKILQDEPLIWMSSLVGSALLSLLFLMIYYLILGI